MISSSKITTISHNIIVAMINNSIATRGILVLDAAHCEEPLPEDLKDRIPRLLGQGIIERIGRGGGVRSILCAFPPNLHPPKIHRHLTSLALRSGFGYAQVVNPSECCCCYRQSRMRLPVRAEH
jgi:hypothetical protein